MNCLWCVTPGWFAPVVRHRVVGWPRGCLEPPSDNTCLANMALHNPVCHISHHMCSHRCGAGGVGVFPLWVCPSVFGTFGGAGGVGVPPLWAWPLCLEHTVVGQGGWACILFGLGCWFLEIWWGRRCCVASSLGLAFRLGATIWWNRWFGCASSLGLGLPNVWVKVVWRGASLGLGLPNGRGHVFSQFYLCGNRVFSKT